MTRARAHPARVDDITCCRPCRDRPDCLWQSRRIRTCTRRTWSFRTIGPWSNGRPWCRYSPRRDRVHRPALAAPWRPGCPLWQASFERGPAQVQRPARSQWRPVPAHSWSLPVQLQRVPRSMLPQVRCCSSPRTSLEHPCGRGMRRAWWHLSSKSRPYISPWRPRERRPAVWPAPWQTLRSVHPHKAK